MMGCLVAILTNLAVPLPRCGHSNDDCVDTDLDHWLWSAKRVTDYFWHGRQLMWFNPQRAVTEEEGEILMSSGWSRTSYQFPAPIPCTDVKDVSLHFCCNFSRRKAFVLKFKHPVSFFLEKETLLETISDPKILEDQYTYNTWIIYTLDHIVSFRVIIL